MVGPTGDPLADLRPGFGMKGPHPGSVDCCHQGAEEVLCMEAADPQD